MVYSVGINDTNTNKFNHVTFGSEQKEKNKTEAQDTLLYEEKKKHPLTTGLKIQADKFINACTRYPKKRLEGSKNSNFYEFLTMGMVPYVVGSAMMIAVFNLASKFFETPAAVSASKLGKKMGIGVIAYGLAKTFSKKLIEVPLNLRYGIDVNLPYKKVVHELPDKDNLNNLVTHEYHKAFESVDFPRWDLFYNNDNYGKERESYYKKVGKKMGLSDKDLEHADQKVKPIIKEKVVKTKLFSTLSSYLWAATAVGVSMQSPWENLVVNPAKRIANFKNYRKLAHIAKEEGRKIAKYDNFAKELGQKFVASCKEFFNNSSKTTRYAGRILLGSAVAMTLLGNFSTLFNFNKNRGVKPNASTSLIDEKREKVVC